MAEIAAGQATIEDLQKQVRQQQLTLTTKDLELENEKARADLAETVVTTTQGRAAGRGRIGRDMGFSATHWWYLSCGFVWK